MPSLAIRSFRHLFVLWAVPFFLLAFFLCCVSAHQLDFFWMSRMWLPSFCPSNGEKESWIFVSTIKTLLSWSPLRDTSPTKFVILLLVLINKRLKHAGPRRGVPEVAYSFFCLPFANPPVCSSIIRKRRTFCVPSKSILRQLLWSIECGQTLDVPDFIIKHAWIVQAQM